MSDNNPVVWLSNDIAACKDAILVLQQESTRDFFDDHRINPIPVESYTVAPWGHDNLLPNHIMDKIEAAEIVGTNANFNWKVCYGLGPKLVQLVRDKKTNKIVDYIEIDEGDAYDFFENNNIPLLLEEMLTDLSYFHNAFPVLIPNAKHSKIEGIRHREALFSRWAVDDKGQIIKHLYSSDWDIGVTANNLEVSEVIDEFDAFNDLTRFMHGKKNEDRYCYPIYMPSPGRPYYSYPNWWSIFRSGWYDNITSIPELKKAILKHNLGVKHIIYISAKYFEDKETWAGIPHENFEERRKLRDKLVEEINDVLAGEENAGKAITALKQYVPSGNGTTVDKYIEIEPIKNDISGGEYLTDYETGANIISYAMEVHPSLIGATPGKNSNSLSGSNVREIFLMKQALSKPMTDQALKVFSLVKKVNKWDKNIAIAIPEYIFTTLDQNKSGKQESTNTIEK